MLIASPSDDFVVLELELVAFAGRLSCAPGDVERKLGGAA
jgi:hypothetical protein